MPLSQRIAMIRVDDEGDGSTYNRDLFGGGWIDADGNGCNTRCEVLVTERRTDLPGIAEGWLSLYDAYSTDNAGELDIDHVVALGEAWRSGADSWDPQRRVAFANDLGSDESLIAVTAATNRSKGDRDPAGWQPPNTDGWCTFLFAWVDTKLRWGLSADPAELAAITNMGAARSC